MRARQKILIVDNDSNMAQLINLYLVKESFDTFMVPDGESALTQFEIYQPNMILLDLKLPGVDGFHVCREIRSRSNIPILIISERTDIFDKVLALELGADDYITKPFDSRELVARVKAVMRRYYSPLLDSSPKETSVKMVEYPDLTVNLTNYRVIYCGRKIDMPPKELELLYFLASSPRQVFTREQLLDHIWGYEYVGDTRTVDVHIKRIRKKIPDTSYWSIDTVWGIGYKFEQKNTNQ